MGRPAHSIDEVIEQLDATIEWARASNSRLGYFPALYRRVTVKVKEGVAEGFFDDGPRMERLDVIFANRYLAALEAWRGPTSPESRPTAVWDYAFTQGGRFWPIVLQHLLLGINAHINLDLGIAAARTVAADELETLRGDFNRINGILAALVGDVQQELAEVWPLLRLFNRFLGTADDKIINFSMERARDFAWATAQRLAPLTENEQQREITRLDSEVVKIAGLIRHPGSILSVAARVVRLGERKTIAETIEILS